MKRKHSSDSHPNLEAANQLLAIRYSSPPLPPCCSAPDTVEAIIDSEDKIYILTEEYLDKADTIRSKINTLRQCKADRLNKLKKIENNLEREVEHRVQNIQEIEEKIFSEVYTANSIAIMLSDEPEKELKLKELAEKIFPDYISTDQLNKLRYDKHMEKSKHVIEQQRSRETSYFKSHIER